MHLSHACAIEDGVTLKDILLLAKPWAVYLSPITTQSPDWMEEIIEEGLSKEFHNDGSIEWLELGWVAEVWDYDGKDEFNIGADFIGMSTIIPKDEHGLYDDWPEDKPVSYAIDFSPVHTLTGYPIKLNTELKVIPKMDWENPILTADYSFSLLQILKGIFWELSFHGSPKSRDEQMEKLKKQMDEIERGEAKLIPWEEVKQRLEEKLEEVTDGQKEEQTNIKDK